MKVWAERSRDVRICPCARVPEIVGSVGSGVRAGQRALRESGTRGCRRSG